MSRPKAVRCAVYTRKSSEEGLEQEYNSLHAQRDACEAYIRSQIGEGWTCLKTAYDDGGISGGTMERPGLKQLLADIAARRIDVVVVYKVDRLTRSLWDFAKIVEVFDKHSVSFVSVTQSFNTTSSMGRLTLNMLLSFAQFEREVTSERIRDKIAASKKKGMWMGGGVPLGYEAEGRTLKINEGEADTVRHIFRRYLGLRSVHKLIAELRADGVKSKRSVFSTGRTRGGCDLDRGALYKLLANPAYLGKVRHKDQVYDGLHPAIVDQETYDAVQALLAENSVKRTSGSARRTSSPLMGKLFDDSGQPMVPTFSVGRGGKRYRYYVSSALQTGIGGAGPGKRIPGPELDGLVTDLTTRLASSDIAMLGSVTLQHSGLELSFEKPAEMEADRWGRVLSHLCDRLSDGERAWSRAGAVVVFSPASVVFRGGRAWLEGHQPRPTNGVDRALVSGLRRGHGIAQSIGLSLEGPAPRAAGVVNNTHERLMAPLAFLAPDIQQAILNGRQPRSLTLSQLQLKTMPMSWAEQRRAFGFAAV
jgi:site-specific DNA recombinase